jgi:hypothetical protein
LPDVRLIEDYEADPILIPKARYRNPENIEQWFSELPTDAEGVVYCVRGNWVSQHETDGRDGSCIDSMADYRPCERRQARNRS